MARPRQSHLQPAPILHCQLYIYHQSNALRLLYLCALSLFGENSEFRAVGLGPTGLRRIPKKPSLSRLFDALEAAFPSGINHFELDGVPASKQNHLGVERALLLCTLSPLCEDWATIGNAGDSVAHRQARLNLYSLASKEGFVRLNRIRRHPISIGIALRLPNAGQLGLISDVFGGLIETLGAADLDGFVGFIDDRPTFSAESVLGGQVDLCQTMDTKFDQPHRAIFGRRRTMAEYGRSMIRRVPALGASYMEIGGSGLVVFKTWPVEEMPKSKWHYLEA